MSEASRGAVLFDMDGVLLDTEPLYTRAYNEVLGPFGASLDAATKLEIMGRRAIDSVGHVIDKLGLPLTPQEFLTRREPILERLFSSAPAVPGAEQFVRSLAAQKVKMAVATSTGRRLFELKTRSHKWFSVFDEIVCGDDPEVKNPKPEPDIFLTAARRLGVPIVSCVVFEDSPLGLQAAVASGARAIALVRESTDLSLYASADQVVANFGEANV